MATQQTRSRIWLWSAIAIIALALLLALGLPTSGLWRCVSAFANGERAQAEVAALSDDGPATVRFGAGAQPRTCTVGRSDLPTELAVGDRLAVVLDTRLPERCTTAEALSVAEGALMAIGAVILSMLLGLLLIGLRLQRVLSQPRALTSEYVRAAKPRSKKVSLDCPGCAKPMREGYLPLVAGIHFRERDEPAGLPHALSGLPGTVGWRRPASLHALRCEACEVVIFRYGKRAED